MERRDRLKLMIPCMPGAAELEPYLQRIDRARWYSNGGPLVGELERKLARLMGGVTTLCVSSATAGLELVLRYLAQGDNLRVLLPAVTFIASARAIQNAGCTPVLCDVDPDTWMLTPEIAQEAMSRTRIHVVMPVAAFGHPIDCKAWGGIANRVPVVIDAAATLPLQAASQHPGVTVVTSLHATKMVGAGEGGTVSNAVVSFVDAIADGRNFGMGSTSGTNAKMSEYHAAVGLASLDPGFLVPKQRFALLLHTLYRTALAERMDNDIVLQAGSDARDNHTVMPVLLPAGSTAADVATELDARGIETRRWYPGLHLRQEFCGEWVSGSMEVANRLNNRLLGLPFHHWMDGEDVERVVTELKAAVWGAA